MFIRDTPKIFHELQVKIDVTRTIGILRKDKVSYYMVRRFACKLHFHLKILG